MKIETQIQEDHQARLTVEVEEDVMEGMKRRAARKIARQVKIPGFRPGKAPYQVVLKHVGEGAVVEEALEILVDDIYPKMIEQAELKPYGPGTLDKVESLEPPVLEFVVPLDAEVTLGDYRSIQKPYEPEEISEQDVEDVLQDLRERQAVIEPANRPAQEGDLVTITLRAVRKVVEEGQDPEIIKERSLSVVIRPDKDDGEEPQEDEWPFFGFSRNLIGLDEGDVKTVSHKFPVDKGPENFRGVEAEFTATVESVKNRLLPELDDEFAKSLGDTDDLQDLRSSIRTSIEDQSVRAYNESYDEAIMDEAIAQTEYKFPPQMLESEIEDIIHELQSSLERQNLDLELYLKTRNLDLDGLKDELRPTAESRLKRALFLYEFAEAEDIQIESEELETETQNTVDFLSQVMTEKEARRLSNQDVYANIMKNVMANLLSRRAMDRFRDICSGRLDEQKDIQGEPPGEDVEPVDEELEIRSSAESDITIEETVALDTSNTGTDEQRSENVDELVSTVHTGENEVQSDE